MFGFLSALETLSGIFYRPPSHEEDPTWLAQVWLTIDFHTFALYARLPNMSPLHGTISKSMFNSEPSNVAFLLGWFKISMSALEVKL